MLAFGRRQISLLVKPALQFNCLRFREQYAPLALLAGGTICRRGRCSNGRSGSGGRPNRGAVRRCRRHGRRQLVLLLLWARPVRLLLMLRVLERRAVPMLLRVMRMIVSMLMMVLMIHRRVETRRQVQLLLLLSHGRRRVDIANVANGRR